MPEPITPVRISNSTKPKPLLNLNLRRPKIMHQMKALMLGIEFLSSAGIISELMTAAAGKSKVAPKIVHRVAWPIGRVV